MPYLAWPGMISNRVERRKQYATEEYATEEEVPVTRIDSVRHAADVTKDSVRHAAEVAAPYANTARESAVHYGKQAGCYSRKAGLAAKQHYDTRLAPQVGQARDQVWSAMPPKATNAVETAARRTREGTRAAADYTAPRVGSAVAATRSVAGPAKDEVVVRGAAALQALRGQVTATEIDRLVRRRIHAAEDRPRPARRADRRIRLRCRRRGLEVVEQAVQPGLAGGAPEPTEVGDRASMNGSGTLTVVDPLDDHRGSVNGSGPRVDRVDGSDLDPGVEAKRSDEEGDR